MTKDNGSLVYSIEEAGIKLGLSRNGAYDAAARGDIPTIRIGRLLKVPKVAFDRIWGAGNTGDASTIAPLHEPAIEPVRELEVLKVRRIPKMPRERKVAMGFTVSIELNNKLVLAAKANGVSLSHEIVCRLERTFETQ